MHRLADADQHGRHSPTVRSDDEDTFELELVSDDNEGDLGLPADAAVAGAARSFASRASRSFSNLPDTTLLHILLTVTDHDDLLQHVSVCARVCKQWYDLVGECPAYAGGRGATFAALSERGELLRKICIRFRRATLGGPQLPGILYLSRDRIGDSGARVLGAALQAIPAPVAVGSLVLSRNALTAIGLRSVAPAMKRVFAGEGLQTLDVGGNRLFCEGLAVLAGMLPTTLSELRVNGTGCGDTGMLALAAALPALTSLRILDCGSNSRIEKDGWVALAAALPQIPALVEVELAWCDGVGNAGAKALAAVLPKAVALQYLGLNWCRIGDAGIQAIATVVPRCVALTNLYLLGGEYGDVSRAALYLATDQHTVMATGDAPLHIRMDSERRWGLLSEDEQSSEGGDSSEEDLG